MEKIKCAAIKFEGEIYTGKRHNDVIYYMVTECGLSIPITGEQGFITEGGKFVGRQEAKIIAREAGQLLPRASDSILLFSEDIY